MEIAAVYEQGRLILQRPVKFRRSRFNVVVNIPDDEVEQDLQTPNEGVARLFGDLAAIRGEGYRYLPSGKSDRELILEIVEEKYGAGR